MGATAIQSLAKGGGQIATPLLSRLPAAGRSYEKLLIHYKRYILGNQNFFIPANILE
jgi:hypothetical protein